VYKFWLRPKSWYYYSVIYFLSPLGATLYAEKVSRLRAWVYRRFGVVRKHRVGFGATRGDGSRDADDLHQHRTT
jgi:hypothetical protein